MNPARFFALYDKYFPKREVKQKPEEKLSLAEYMSGR